MHTNGQKIRIQNDVDALIRGSFVRKACNEIEDTNIIAAKEQQRISNLIAFYVQCDSLNHLI